jgi:hypothetical protein
MNNRFGLHLITALFCLNQAVVAQSISYSRNNSNLLVAANDAASVSRGISEKLMLEKNVPEAYIDVFPNVQSVSSAAGTVTFSVNTDGELWTVSDDASWLTATKTNATTITVTYEENTSALYRNGNITAIGPLKTSETVILMQNGAPPFLDILFEMSYVPPDRAGILESNVNTNTEWNVTDDASWLTAIKFNENTIRISYDANTSNTNRTAIVTATGTGGASDYLTVEQGAAYYINIDPENRNVSSASGSASFKVNSNIGFNVFDDASWLTTTKIDENTISVSYEENTSTSSRSAMITAFASAGSLTETVTVIQDGAEPFISLYPTGNQVGSSAGSISFSVTTNVDWTVTDDASWVNATKSNSGLVIATYDENPSGENVRQAQISVTGTGGVSQVYSLLQENAQPYFNITPNEMEFGSASGSVTFSVSANVDWSVTDDGPWLTTSKTNGTTITVSYDQNTSTSSRKAYVTASGGGVSETVTVTQEGATAWLDVSPNSSNVTSASGSATFSVSGNVDWSVSADGSWLTATKTDESTISVSFDENASAISRAANITVTGTGGVSEIVILTQEGVNPWLDVTPDSLIVGPEAGSGKFSVSGNVDWSVTDDGSWLTATKSSESTIHVDYDENTSDNVRTANIITTGTGGISETITVRQDRKLATGMIPLEDHDVLIYPNPAEGIIYIKATETTLPDISVSVTDALGRLVYMKRYDQISVNEEKDIDVSDLNRGIYYIIIGNENINTIHKIIKY